jgi:hypothetical protein
MISISNFIKQNIFGNVSSPGEAITQSYGTTIFLTVFFALSGAS